MYLLFMVVIFLLIQLYFIDKSTRTCKLNFYSFAFYMAILTETIIVSILSIWLFSKDWKLELRTCGVKSFSDWYTLFYNPSMNSNFHCTHEAVYPLYSIVFLFYILSLGLVLMRHFFLQLLTYCIYLLTSFIQTKNLLAKDYLTKNIYYALYSLPALMFIHAIFAGIICEY